MKFVVLSFYIMVNQGPLHEVHALTPDMKTCQTARQILISEMDQDENEVSFWVDCTEQMDV